MHRWLVPLTLALVCACAEQQVDDQSSEQPPQGVPSSKEAAAEETQSGKADWSLDPCDWWGWYSDGHCDWFCPQRDADCDQPVLFADPTGSPTIHPIVLAHGFDASPEDALTNRWAFFRVKETLEADGHRVCEDAVPPYESAEVRAGYLRDNIVQCLELMQADKVNIVAHSMGGLDARHAISSMGLSEMVASLTTISTAHRGTRVADVALKAVPGLIEPVVDALAGLWGRTYSDLSEDSHVKAALTSLAEANAPTFNAANPDAEGVYYQSWAGVSSALGLKHDPERLAETCDHKVHLNEGTADHMNLTLKLMAPITGHGIEQRLNDGMVTVESAKWGTFRGCIPADHMDEVGQYHHEEPDRNTGFDHLLFYRALAYDLAGRGF